MHAYSMFEDQSLVSSFFMYCGHGVDAAHGSAFGECESMFFGSGPALANEAFHSFGVGTNLSMKNKVLSFPSSGHRDSLRRNTRFLIASTMSRRSNVRDASRKAAN